MDGLIVATSKDANRTTSKRQSFSADGATAAFTVTDFTMDSLNLVVVNGFVADPDDYSYSGSTVTFDTEPAAGTVVIHGYETVRLADLEAAYANTGSEVHFDKPRHYGTPSSPITGDVTFSFDNAKLGQVAVMCHNDSSAPTLPSEAVVLVGSYTTSVDNYITFHYFSNGVVLVSYAQV